MVRTSKIDRARRNALKAAGLVGGFLATFALSRQGSAAPGGNGRGNGNGGANGNGGNSNGNGNGNAWGNNGGRCFMRGTQILTRTGYRSIETLEAGDEVAVQFAGFARIKGVARHTVTNVSGEWDGDRWNRPMVIRRDALGENMPVVDLCLTALHAVHVDGFLVEARDLADGDSVAFVPAEGHETLDFFGIELERHDILDVQGAFCESVYRKGMERCAPLLRFDGGRSRLGSHLRSVASVVVDRRRPIDIIRDRLDERAAGFARAA